MSLILLIDTSSDISMIALAEKGEVLIRKKGEKGTTFSLHGAAAEIFDTVGKKPFELDAISVISGPGSYTGLRVGMAAAKGLCYSLRKELITIGSLEVMAKAAIDLYSEPQDKIYCPMIDARRDEVFSAIYDSSLNVIISPAAVILQPDSFRKEAEGKNHVFFGSGSGKWGKISGYPVNIVPEEIETFGAFAALSTRKLADGTSENLISKVPDYLKEFFFFR
jgi:tRNA threonylcarbamoyladenosine biosynthesis protein TsaB